MLPVVSNGTFSPLQLQLSVEEAQSRVFEMEQELSLLQRERDEAQKAAVQLQSSVDQLTQVRTCVTVFRLILLIFLLSLFQAQKTCQI